jgi:hypothetical protein
MIAAIIPNAANSLPWPMILFMMAFSLGLALFYTLIIGKVAELKIRPSWLFFALLPAIVGACGAIKTEWSAYAIVALFALLFLITLLIMGINFVRGTYVSIHQYYSDKKSGKLKKKPFVPLWKKMLSLGFAIAMIVAFFLGTHIFIIVFISTAFFSALLPSSKKTFLQLQADLPTSKIRSMAMGLVELKGRVAMAEPLKAPLTEKDCIGYRYTIEDISRDSDGDEHFSTIEDNTVCHRFTINDGTGQVEVKPEGINFVWIAQDDSYRSNNKRHSQYLLLDGDEIFLVGNAALENNVPVIELDSLQTVLTVAPIKAVEYWNTYKPLLNAFLMCNAMLAFFVAITLVTPMVIKDRRVTLKFNEIYSSLNSAIDINEDQQDAEGAGAAEAEGD